MSRCRVCARTNGKEREKQEQERETSAPWRSHSLRCLSQQESTLCVPLVRSRPTDSQCARGATRATCLRRGCDA
eukprot:6211248-Pleurochrysis_carterae.AAC.1